MLAKTFFRAFARKPLQANRILFRRFSEAVKPVVEDAAPKQETAEDDEPKIDRSSASTHSFQAETKRLLQIVAKSLYTDKDVFVRELLSNCSDALEKQKFLTLTGKSFSTTPLQINLITHEAKRQLIFQDTGVGMDKEELIDLLGTIAGSGSRKFIEKLQQESNVKNLEENIIGQFGVGFYSAFIVADTLEVYSKKESSNEAYVWVSDGSGTFDVSRAENFHLTHGTRIVLNLKPEFVQFARADQLKTVIDKYSNFISHPIFVNQDRINVVSALWSRDKREVSQTEYDNFFEYLTKSKTPYKYKTHFITEVPLAIKALLYVPSHNAEMFGYGQSEPGVSLYSRKVLIKPACKELTPNYLRFVKGVVDCEDIPLNISRENYQDSALIAKLRSIVTKRVLKMLEEEAQRNPQDYNKWHKDFHIFLKEGIHSDRDNAETLLSLSRFDSSFGEQISLDEYLTKMKPNQKNIYFFLAQSKEAALTSPYMEPFIKNDVPVLFISINIEEMLFRQMEVYKKFRFINIESSEAEIPKELQKEETIAPTKENVPADDVSSLCLWIRSELQPVVSVVNVSKRLISSPAVIISQTTTGMRQMMALMDPTQSLEANKNLTLEINPTHPIIVKMNALRKVNVKEANNNLKQLLDICLLSTGITFDVKNFIRRSNQFIEQSMNTILEGQGKNADNSGSAAGQHTELEPREKEHTEVLDLKDEKEFEDHDPKLKALKDAIDKSKKKNSGNEKK